MKQRILITGATSGFGAGAALGLAAAGHRVTVAGETWAQVTAFRERADEAKAKLTVIKLDLRDPLDLDHAADREVDVLVLNAGVQEAGSLVDLPLERMRRSFDVNLFGHLELVQRIVPQMISRKSGKVVWMSSVAGLVAVPFLGAYAATKHAIEAVASTMKAELNPFGIAVATLNPGVYRTGFNDTGAESYGQWSNDRTVHIPMPDAAPLLAAQHDPQPMIDAMIDAIPDRKGAYRTMLPEDAVLAAKASQELGWTQRAK